MASGEIPSTAVATFGRMSARRLLILGGIALVAGGMFLGDIFAVFFLHQNGRLQGQALIAATRAVAARNPTAVKDIFEHLGGTLEDRGTKVDAHVHMIDAGYLALLLALLQPFVALSTSRKKFLATLFIAGGLLLPIGIFLIHYVGVAHSPFPVLGWGSIVADSAGALLIIALLGEAWGLWNYACGGGSAAETNFPQEDSWSRRSLLSGGTVLVFLGFLHAGWYASGGLYPQ